MLENITLNVKYGNDKEMTLSFPESVNATEFLDNVVVIMKWLTYSDGAIQDAITGYYEE